MKVPVSMTYVYGDLELSSQNNKDICFNTWTVIRVETSDYQVWIWHSAHP